MSIESKIVNTYVFIFNLSSVRFVFIGCESDVKIFNNDFE